MHLMGVAKLVQPKWEPDQGWRVLDPDCHLVNAGGKTIIEVHFEAGQFYMADGTELPMLGQERM